MGVCRWCYLADPEIPVTNIPAIISMWGKNGSKRKIKGPKESSSLLWWSVSKHRPVKVGYGPECWRGGGASEEIGRSRKKLRWDGSRTKYMWKRNVQENWLLPPALDIDAKGAISPRRSCMLLPFPFGSKLAVNHFLPPWSLKASGDTGTYRSTT